MGGNTYNRQCLDDDELLPLVNFAIDNLLTSLRDSNRVFKTLSQWKADVPRLLDRDSSRRFYYLLLTATKSYYCEVCGVELGIKDFEHTKFKRHCCICTKEHKFRRKENLDEGKLKQRGKKITDSKLKFYQTERGKEVAKSIGLKNAVNTKNFLDSDLGKISKKKAATKQSTTMIDKIIRGEFTPTSNNRNTHWDASFGNEKFRSTWEAFYRYLNPDDEYETLRIKYYDDANRERAYIVDFVNHTTKTVTEVKPRNIINEKSFQFKLKSLNKWANDNNYTVILADFDYLFSHSFPSDLTMFDENSQRKIIKYYAQIKNKINT
jgi:hypothetical protein